MLSDGVRNLIAFMVESAHQLSMARSEDELIPTRVSLLGRLKDWQDQAGWQEFFDTYWPLIYGVARQSGLNDAEAQDVVQETMSSVAKHMPRFVYNPAIGSFKTWLLNMTRWRIADQMRKRVPVAEFSVRIGDSTAGIDANPVDHLADPASLNLNALWETEWEENLLTAAIARVKRRSDPEKYQIFDLYAQKGLPAEKVASIFGVSIDQVYLIKHRLTDAIKDEVRRLEKEMT